MFLAHGALAQAEKGLWHINPTQVLIGPDHQPLKIAQGTQEKPVLVTVTLGYLCEQALTAQLPEDKSMVLEQKLKIGALAARFYDQHGAWVNDVALTPDEVVLLRDRVGEFTTAVYASAAIPLIDPSKAQAK